MVDGGFSTPMVNTGKMVDYGDFNGVRCAFPSAVGVGNE